MEIHSIKLCSLSVQRNPLWKTTPLRDHPYILRPPFLKHSLLVSTEMNPWPRDHPNFNPFRPNIDFCWQLGSAPTLTKVDEWYRGGNYCLKSLLYLRMEGSFLPRDKVDTLKVLVLISAFVCAVLKQSALGFFFVFFLQSESICQSVHKTRKSKGLSTTTKLFFGLNCFRWLVGCLFLLISIFCFVFQSVNLHVALHECMNVYWLHTISVVVIIVQKNSRHINRN